MSTALTRSRSHPWCSGARNGTWTCSGTRTELFAFAEYLDDKFRVNLILMIGPGGEGIATKILKRFVKFNHALVCTWRGDERHVKGLSTLLNLEGSKASETPDTKDTVKSLSNAEDELNHLEAKRFQSGSGIVTYHSLDDDRVQFETGIVMRGMAKPRVRDMACLVRSARYLKGAPSCEWAFKSPLPLAVCRCPWLRSALRRAITFHSVLELIRRVGCGRLKLVQARFQWPQEAVATGRVEVTCIDTSPNTSELVPST